MRTEWCDRLKFASEADVSELIVPGARTNVSVALHDFGSIPAEHTSLLERWGLPEVKGCLYPRVGQATEVRADLRGCLLGTYESPARPNGDVPAYWPEHLYVAEARTGHVVKVPSKGPDYRVEVNSNVALFAEMMWRYFHMRSVLREAMSIDDPPIDPAESSELRLTVWEAAVRVDPAMAQTGEESFWWGASWEFL